MTITINRRHMLAMLGATTAIASLPGAALGQMQSVRIGTSSVGSVFYTLAIGAGEIIRDYASINTTVEPVGGSAANVNGLNQGNIDLAVSNSFSSFSGYNAMYGFPQPVEVRLVLQGQPSYRWIFTRPGSGIESAQDLEGRTIVGDRRALPELRILLDAVIEHFGLDASTINIVETNETNEAIEAMRTGAVDAVVLPFSPRAGQIEEPISDGAMEFLKVSVEDRDAILELLPNAFYGVDQPADDFSNQPEMIPLTSLNTYLIAHADLDDDTAYAVAKALFENNEEFISYHATARSWTIENLLQSPAVPFHPGVIRYLEETGHWNAELAALQDELLAR
ncbi:MAG: hypothetical protein CMJ15_01710 [Pelagibacterium sp.]|mgnify:CR=1 FL=1|nr:hypothetical protein [Pelagibacterium sp.]|tara:strand:- start:5202 stop:6212 length:1011 start_codon:yes stop_codon:yes gene_type:complete